MRQERNRMTLSQLMAQIQELQIRTNSLSDARELYYLESGSSSGATHVPDQTSTILSPRTLPRCDSGLPCDTRNGTGITRNGFERPPAQEGLSSAIFNNSKNLASSSQESTVETARKRDSEMKKRESLNTSVPSPHFLSRKWYVESYWWNFIFTMVWWIIQEFLLRNGILEIFLTLWNFESWKVNFRTEVRLRTADPQITTLWSKEVDIAEINWRTYDLAIDHGERFSWLRYAWCRWLRQPWRSFSTRSQISDKEQVSKSSVLKNTTDSYEEDRLCTWCM